MERERGVVTWTGVFDKQPRRAVAAGGSGEQAAELGQLLAVWDQMFNIAASFVFMRQFAASLVTPAGTQRFYACRRTTGGLARGSHFCNRTGEGQRQKPSITLAELPSFDFLAGILGILTLALL